MILLVLKYISSHSISMFQFHMVLQGRLWPVHFIATRIRTLFFNLSLPYNPDRCPLHVDVTSFSYYCAEFMTFRAIRCDVTNCWFSTWWSGWFICVLFLNAWFPMLLQNGLSYWLESPFRISKVCWTSASAQFSTVFPYVFKLFGEFMNAKSILH